MFTRLFSAKPTIKNKTIAIVGAGVLGNALYSIYPEALFFSRRMNHKVAKSSLAELKGAHYLFLTVSAQDTKATCLMLQPALSKNAHVIICAKGIDFSSGKFLFEVAQGVLPTSQILVLSGPNFASELAKHLPAVSSIAAKDDDIAEVAATDLSRSGFKLFPTDDITTVSLIGALKNVLAIACGVIRGLGLGENLVAAAVTKGTQEILLLAKARGGSPSTITSAAGIGDIFLTCSSLESRNTRFGMHVVSGKGTSIDPTLDTIEGIYTALSLNRYYDCTQAPLLHYVWRIVTKEVTSKEAMAEDLIRLLA
jgi:glycerol-3-phosphate dehydrogenase (NAD(P)+)